MVNIILNTDIGCDADDVGALALLNSFSNLSEANVLAVTHCTSNQYAIKCSQVINEYYKNNFQLGEYRGDNFIDVDHYARAVYETFGCHNTIKYQESVELMREKLFESKDESVTLVSIGQLNTLNELLKSKSDSKIKESGYDLICNKVKEVVIMGGYFNKPKTPLFFENKEYKVEYNIEMDIQSAKNFIENAPCNIVFVDFYIGYLVKTIKPLLDEMNLKNPITYAYKEYNKGPRESWDLLAVYYSVRGKENLFTLSPKGHVTVGNDGETNYHEDKKGKHQILRLKQEPYVISNVLNKLIIDNLPGGTKK